ncbi:MAG: type II toxin-antitoxin system VapC family toxin [Deltaproteobacteria bacterium]|nr:type II toxin-antitoxin system VapC family toxin [Deltaproteobacteria bacterium]
MRYLLDTHIFLWSLFEPEKIHSGSADVIKSQENSVFVSVITFWEISLKYALGKLELKGVEPHELPGYAAQINFEILDFKPEDAASFYQLPRLSHKDPFDRIIIWQAIQNNMVLLSKDKEFPEYQRIGLRILSD